ncbi:hypothetical protein [Mycobacterium tuberculosis]|uniref:hypothetical protein n=1 Tax=Mycobacterium tuberculosis TaxID=1773 RepID=UPI0019551A6B|nr:hypothetical protein [Mycobacterium tuberculosis]
MCRLSGNAATNLERPGEEPPGDRCTRRQAVRPARTLAKKGNIPVGYYKDEKKTAQTEARPADDVHAGHVTSGS